MDLGTTGLTDFGRAICARKFLVDAGQGAAQRIDGGAKCGVLRCFGRYARHLTEINLIISWAAIKYIREQFHLFSRG